MNTQNLALLLYVFAHDEHDEKVAPHGNSLKAEGYVRTKPSVLTSLKKLSSESTAKRVLSFASAVAGGVVNAPSASSLPCSRQQVNDLRRKHSKSSEDALYSLMLMCKEGEGNKDAFVRVVNAAPYPMMVLAFDWMLDDLVRFCTVPGSFSVLSVDPTFSLGSFDVTVTTYRHLLLKSGEKHPYMIGPLFVHLKKDFAAYHFFASSLVGKRQELLQLKCYGSDGEAALVNAFSTVFPNALHLRCFLHFRGNIERKLRELNIPAEESKRFIIDIFGCPSKLETGLVDSKDETEFHFSVSSLEKKWNEIEEKYSSPPTFHSWFRQHCLDVVRCCMLYPVRERAGLGSPPEPFYINAVESKNNVLKQHLQRKSSSLPDFVEGMKALLNQQYQEIELAVASMGEYRVVSMYSHLSYEQSKWFKMSTKQRLAKVAQFMKHTIDQGTTTNTSSTPDNNPLTTIGLLGNMANTNWKRAQCLVCECAVVAAPGDDSGALVVKSNSGQRPHYVKPMKKGGFSCDEQCIGYKSSRICSHTVAAALKAYDISSYVRWFKGLKVTPNFTNLAEHGRPQSAGKKPRKGASKKESQKK